MTNPEPTRAIALAAFTGWNDAGNASSDALAHLMNEIGVDESTEPGEKIVNSNDFVDFQINRPRLVRHDSGKRVIEWPHTRIIPLNPHDGTRIFVILGPEPSIDWTGYCALIIARLNQLEVDTLITLGALLADTPHTRPLPVSTSCVEADGAEPVQETETAYEGPIGIPTVLAQVAAWNDVSSTSMWVQVPNYVGQNPAPKATLALIRALERELDMSLPLGDLPDDAEAWERGMTELAENEEDIGAYVQQLEQVRDAAELPEASGDAIASEFEQFLRRREDESDA